MTNDRRYHEDFIAALAAPRPDWRDEFTRVLDLREWAYKPETPDDEWAPVTAKVFRAIEASVRSPHTVLRSAAHDALVILDSIDWEDEPPTEQMDALRHALVAVYLPTIANDLHEPDCQVGFDAMVDACSCERIRAART